MDIALNPDLSKQHTLTENNGWYDARVDINLIREPKRFIYIFTVSKRGFTIERPPLFPMLHVPACGPDQRYRMVAKIPDPFNQAVMNTENWRIRGEAHDGLRVAIDLINPNNITNDPDWEVPVKFAGALNTGTGCDLSRQGVFLSLGEEPSIQQIEKAEKKVHGYYEWLRSGPEVGIELMDEKDARYAASMNKDYGMMADYFGLTYPWHGKKAAMVECPNCGERIAKGAPWHVSSLGPCINDWKAAVRAGIKKTDEVPGEILAEWTAPKPSEGKARR